PAKRRVDSDSSSDEGVVDKTPIKKSKGGSGNRVKNADGEEEQGRTVDSPLGQLDPSRITHMVVDQVGFGGSTVQSSDGRFVVPGPPHQQWIRSSPAASPSIVASPSKRKFWFSLNSRSLSFTNELCICEFRNYTCLYLLFAFNFD
ncbi:hypothetical protein OESDEN_15905, partial [Oesophagostomum dentatum]